MSQTSDADKQAWLFKELKTFWDGNNADKQTWLREELEKFWESKNAKDGESQSIRREQKRTSGSPDGKSQLIPQEQEQMSESPDWKMEELPSWRENINTDIKCSQLEVMSLLDKKLEGVQSQLQDQLTGRAKKIEQMSNSLNSRDYKDVQGMGKQKALSSMELATKRDLQQLEMCLEEKFSGTMSTLRGSSADEKLGQQEILERKMEELSSWRENLKADITSSQLEVMSLLDKKLEGVRSQLQDPLSELAKQIEEEKALSSTELATKRDLQQLEICLEEKFSGMMSTLRGSSADEKLGQQEILVLEKKMEEQLKAEIKTSLGATEMLLDEKLGSVQTQLEAWLQNPLSGLETQIKQLTNQLSSIDQKVSQEIEKKLQTIHSMQFASRDELQQWKDLLEKKLSTSQPTLEISHLEKKLEQIENSVLQKKMEEQLKVEINTSLGVMEKLLDEKLGRVQTCSEAQLQNPLLGLETQIKLLTNQLSSIDQKVSQEIEKKLKTIDSMQFASRDELQQWKDLLEKKLSASQSTLEMSHLEKKLEQLENSEKKMEELLKVEIKNSLWEWKTLLDEKLKSVQTQLETQLRNPLSHLATQITQLTTRLSSIDENASQEEEKKHEALATLQFANKDELQQEKYLKKQSIYSKSTPNLSSVELKLRPQETSEMEKLRTELDWRRARNNADDITLGADTAHPNLSIAGDKNFTHEAQPQKVPLNPGRFDSTVCVLGSEGFTSEKHYWEVDIGSSTDWDLGVARKSAQRKGKLSLSAKEGIWALSQSGRDYWAKTDPWTRIIVKKKPKKIGVYLSYQEGQVTFFNVTDMSVLFTFNDCSFSGEIYPLFKNSHKETTMRICSIKEE